MTASVLGHLSLRYRPLWSARRQLAGVQLFADTDSVGADGGHLLRTVTQLWSGTSPPLLLSPQSPALLQGALAQADAQSPRLEVPVRWLQRSEVAAALRQAQSRGAPLLASGSAAELAPWRGVAGASSETGAGNAGIFKQRLLVLDAADAALALSASLALREDAAQGRIGRRSDSSPVQPGDWVAGVAGRALLEHALDQQGAAAVAGWPVEDVLHAWQGQSVAPTRRAILRAMSALDREQPLDAIEHVLAQEATLAYRLLAYLNSAGLGIRNGVASLRHGVMMIGYRTLNGWLAEQLPTAGADRDLEPVHSALGLRASLAAELVDAGIELDLRHEVFLTAMFSQLDLLQGQSLRALLARLPLPERIPDALLRDSGPYAGVLRLARAMEGESARAVGDAVHAAGLSVEESNRALLRVLATAGG